MFSKDRKVLCTISVNSTYLPTDPKANMKSCEDFLTITLHGLIKAGAKQLMEENPSALSDVNKLSELMIDKFVNLNKPLQSTDDLHFYTTELFALLLVWHNYRDSVREGDGNRVMELWKFLLVILKKSRRTNYSIEALTRLV